MTIYGKIWKKVSDETIATPRSVQISAGFIIEWKKVNEWIPELCYNVITREYRVSFIWLRHGSTQTDN